MCRWASAQSIRPFGPPLYSGMMDELQWCVMLPDMCRPTVWAAGEEWWTAFSCGEPNVHFTP